MINAIDYYRKKINKNLTVENWGFKKKKNAFTHTMAYTIRGFLESSILLNDDKLFSQSLKMSLIIFISVMILIIMIDCIFVLHEISFTP